MPARITPLVTEEYYHLFNRGINKQPIFFGIKDFKRALEILEFYSFANSPTRYSKFLLLPPEYRTKIWQNLRAENDKLVNIICFCFMPNHFHFLLKQNKDGGVSKFMRIFQNSFTRYINTKYKKIGPILQGPFKAVRVENDDQLLHLVRYVHLNPYTSYIVKTLDKLLTYQWSSLPEYLGKADYEICNKEIILSSFKARKDFLKFTSDQAEYQRELDKIKHLSLENNSFFTDVSS